ncbi:unnamed protein product [Owenia fusiformis]|uniref:Kinesin-like protein n=1 Tax=Owenia fusiformis TaxID=6347 RepID=A0A8S4P8Y4_OWEFU|nr:unnamed protein product [Owenia fusiformis]
MVKQTIQIFSRVKPTKAKIGLYEIDEDDSGSPRLTFTVPKDLAVGLVNNKKENYKFRFQRVFDQKTKQEEVFEHVGQPVVDNVLSGYNGTIFAYGQTGSGKTFTITGGPEKYADRGIIPRTLSYIFQQFEQNPDYVYTCHISYLEIYNESGYDLLDPKHESSKLEDLPKVHLMEDSDQNIHLKNLSTHQANNEEEALNLLFLGDTNRMIAETPMNQASTRSHCIFTIHVSSRQAVGASIRRSKLHLVDLAGSERVAKTGVAGTLLAEAKYINLSLHFLEQVIVTLSEKGRSHIPYRNSMMTSVLRDSLGGNCMTTMIATCSAEKKNIDINHIPEYNLNMRFTGKAVIITGSNSGIGKATALLFAREGASVLIHGRSLETIEETVKECKDVGGKDAKFPFVQGYVANDDVIMKIKDTALNTFGKIDILVNNAGAGNVLNLSTGTMQNFQETVNVLLRAPVQLSQVCLPELKQTQGNIVNMSSIFGIRPNDLVSFYCIAKAGLNMFTKCAALEFGALGVRVNALCPGCVPTPIYKKSGFTEELTEAFYNANRRIAPIGKNGNVEETAKMIAFIASDDASMMNGECIVLDGGTSLCGLDSKAIEDATK